MTKKHIIMPNDEVKKDIIDQDNNEGADGGDQGGADGADAGNGKGEEGKPKETPAEKVARLEGILKRARKDAGIEDPEIKPEKKTSKKSDGLGYAEKAYLIATGIKEADEVSLVEQVMADTGKSLEAVIGSRFFQAELKDMRDARMTADATPGKGKRSGQSAQDTVEYWLAKGELPPASERELRQKVVNARIKKESNTSQFTNTPVGSNK